MTRREIFQTMIEFLEEELGKDEDAGAEGKVVWPPNDDMSHIDAMATLGELSAADLFLTFHDETGNMITDVLSISFSSTQLYPGAPAHFARQPLKKLIEDELKLYIDERNSDCRPARLLARLVKAFDE